MSIFEEFEFKGIEKGITLEKHSTIIRSWKNGIDISMISNITSLPVSEINRVIAEHQPKTMSIFDEFEQKGFEKGVKKGNKIVELLLEGVSASDIAKSVDLPVEQIESIIADFQF